MRIGRHDVPISNPDKVFFPEPGLTKGDVVRYYVDVAGCGRGQLPHCLDGEAHDRDGQPGVPAVVRRQAVPGLAVEGVGPAQR